MMSQQPSNKKPRRGSASDRFRVGSVVVLTLMLMVVLIGMVAFAVDLGYITHVRTELQRTADASALAAAENLPHLWDSATAARSYAAKNNWSSGVKIGSGDEENGADLDPMQIEFGLWNRRTATFTTPTPSGRRTNAVRVTLRRTEATKNPLRLFFGRVLGQNSTDVTATATAWSDRGVCGPFVGIEWLDVSGGAVTDSFNSAEAAYNPATARDEGDVCSDGPIGVSGGSIVNGDATAGEDDVVTFNGSGTVTGYIGNRLEPLNLPPVQLPPEWVFDNDEAPMIWQGQSYRSPFGNNGDFTLNAGETYTLPQGEYLVRNMTINGGATLNFSDYGQTKIYVTGTIKRAGGSYVNTNTMKAGNLYILSTGGTIDITSDNSPFYGVIYAPQSRVTLNGDAELFGAVVANTLAAGGSGGAHYDESLDLEWLGIPPRTMLVD